jgi:hypothetical protein
MLEGLFGNGTPERVYYHWSDPQCLEQALAVARRHPVDLTRIAAWSRRKAAQERYRNFAERLRDAG